MLGCNFDVSLYTLLGTSADVATGTAAIVVRCTAGVALVVVLAAVVIVVAVVVADAAAVLLVGLPLATGVDSDVTRTIPQTAMAVMTALAPRIAGRRRWG
jgi:hypothetical protein